LIGRPSVVTSNWKSTAYTQFGCIRDYGAALAIVPAAVAFEALVRAKGIAFSRD
jgi:hypothetical protein